MADINNQQQSATAATENNVSFLFDTDVARYSTNSVLALYETTYLNLTLHGLRLSFNRLVQSTVPIEFAFTDRMKELLEKRSGQGLKYPYAYIVLNDMDLVKDQINTSSMSYSGASRRKIKGDSAPVDFNFPVKFNMTLNVVDSDDKRMLSLVQALFLADVCRGFNFGIKANDSVTKVKVTRTSNVSFPESFISTDSEQDFATARVTMTFEVQTKVGFSALVPTIQQLNINVYNVDNYDGTEVSKLDCIFTVDLSEDLTTGGLTNKVTEYIQQK